MSKIGTNEVNKNDLVLSEEEISEKELLGQVRERSVLLNSDFFIKCDDEENEKKQEDIILPSKKEKETSENESQDSELFPMLMSIDNMNRPDKTYKTKKDIYDDMSISLNNRISKKEKNNLMDIEFSRDKSKKKEKNKTANKNLKITNRNKPTKKSLVENWFEIKTEAEVERIMDIYYCKDIKNKWKLPL